MQVNTWIWPFNSAGFDLFLLIIVLGGLWWTGVMHKAYSVVRWAFKYWYILVAAFIVIAILINR